MLPTKEPINTNPESSYERTEVSTEWPYAKGFQSEYVQSSPVELKVTGQIPDYTAGIFYRTGPCDYKVKTDDGKTWEADHWFDSLSTIHRFEMKNQDGSMKVFYRSRRICDDLIEGIRKTGSLEGFTFAQKKDPCQNLFKKVMSEFEPEASSAKTSSDPNIGVTIQANMPGIPISDRPSSHSTGIATLITKTDSAYYQRLDPETLEPVGICDQTVLHPDLKGELSSAHSRTCPVTGDVFNYNLELGPQPTYRVFQACAADGQAKVLATIEAKPAYLHSLFISESTVLLCVWNSHYIDNGASILENNNTLDAIAPLDKSDSATWYVIDRTPARRGVIATYTTPAFFAFHAINAYEEPSSTDPSKVDIVADIPTFSDLSILHRFYYENILPKDPSAPSYRVSHPSSAPSLTRYRLPGVPLHGVPVSQEEASKPRAGQVIFSMDPSKSVELPVINPRYQTKSHRYVYGMRDNGNSGYFDGLLKVDTKNQTAVSWAKQGHTSGEPIFVPAPREIGRELDEDEGVLLSIVLDGFKGHSYLLCLDAKTMTEFGRADVDGAVGFGFHGTYIPEKLVDAYSGGD